MIVALFRTRFVLILAVLFFFQHTTNAQLPLGSPATGGISAERLARMDAVIQAAIGKKELPGAVVLVGRHGKIVWRKAYGARAVEPQREPMTTDTIFDLASLTKVVATTTSIMILIEQGKIRLGDSVVQFIPEMKGEGRDAITIEQLLTHMTVLLPTSICAIDGPAMTRRSSVCIASPCAASQGHVLFTATSTTSHSAKLCIGSAD